MIVILNLLSAVAKWCNIVFCNLEYNHFGVPEGCVLRPLFFFIYISDLHCAVRSSSVRHFEDDTKLLNQNNSVKRMNKKNLKNWQNANKICLNIIKTEVVLVKSARKQVDIPLKLKLNRKKLYPTNSFKYQA